MPNVVFFANIQVVNLKMLSAPFPQESEHHNQPLLCPAIILTQQQGLMIQHGNGKTPNLNVRLNGKIIWKWRFFHCDVWYQEGIYGLVAHSVSLG